MSAGTQNGQGPQLKSAIDDVVLHGRALVQGEIELAKAEVTQKAKKLGKGAAIGAAAGVFVLGALLMLLHGFAWLLWYVLPFPNQTIFWGFFLEAGVLLLFAAIAGLLAARAFKAGSPPTPQMAIDEAQRIKATVEEARR
jgi:hypothetical protein